MNPPPPKFAVGEEVIVIARIGDTETFERFEATVTNLWWEPTLIVARTGQVFSSWVYTFDSAKDIYLEDCLHKKPKPDEEFERFMGKLNLTTPIKEGEPA